MSESGAHLALKIATIILMIAGGLLLAMASHPSTALLTNIFFDLVFFPPLNGAETAAEPVSRFLSALAGGGFLGFGITFWMILTRLMPKDPQLAKSIMTSGLFGWFVVDSAGSLISGAWFNAVINCAILFCFIFPLKFIIVDQHGISAKN